MREGIKIDEKEHFEDCMCQNTFMCWRDGISVQKDEQPLPVAVTPNRKPSFTGSLKR